MLPPAQAYGGAKRQGNNMAIEQVGIVGAGQMGNGIAHVFALAGYEVMVNDISEDNLTEALKVIDRNMERQVSKDLISQSDKTEALRRIGTTATLTDLGKTDLIIEAATERETIKTAIFEDLVPHLKPETILTSNTSSISITRLASRTDRPEMFMGFHFMNPVPIMQLVELIPGSRQMNRRSMPATVLLNGLAKSLPRQRISPRSSSTAS